MKKISAKKKAGKIAKGSMNKMAKVLKEFKGNKLHSGSKKGPVVSSKKQAVAIGLSEARKAGAKIPKAPKKASGRAYVRTA